MFLIFNVTHLLFSQENPDLPDNTNNDNNDNNTLTDNNNDDNDDNNNDDDTQSSTPIKNVPKNYLTSEEEAPEAIFELEILDRDVDFFLNGSWEASLFGTTGLLIRPGKGVSGLDAFPGVDQGIIFNQIPDLTFSVWLMERYFVTFSVLGSFDKNSFLIGYQGKEDEFLRHLYIGNKDICIDPYPFLTIPEQGDSSIGVEAELKSGLSVHQLLLRFDNNDSGEKVFIGKNEATEEITPFNGYITGRYFKLPDCDVDNLEVYIEDQYGIYSDLNNSLERNDGRKYRKASLEDAVLDSENGLVSMKYQPTGRVLVYYKKGGNEVGHNTLGQNALPTIDGAGIIDPDISVNFNWATTIAYLDGDTMADRRKVTLTLGAKQCLLLWEPGVFSAFDIQASYTLPCDAPQDLWRIRISAVPTGSKKACSYPIHFNVKPDESRFTAYKNSDLRGDLNNLYPFLDKDERLYGPYTESIQGNYNEELLVKILHPVSGYYLESNVLPGSVHVLRNGVDESRFTVDYDTGELTFETTIHPNDRIEIFYKKYGSLLNNGDLLFAWGNHMPVNESLSLEFGTGFRWNSLPGTYSEKAFSRTGAIIACAGINGEYDNLTFNMQAGLSYTNPDTTGILRLLGMEESGIDISLSEDLAFPAGLPNSTIAGPDLLPGGLTWNNRGKLFYKDYRDYDFLGSFVLQGPDWNPPSEQIFEYESGSKSGPYNVAGSSGGGDEGRSLVLDFDLTDLTDSKEWTGIQIPVTPGGKVTDLSSLKGFFFSYKARDVSVSSDFDVYLQIGEIGEDIDGDGILDKEYSASSTGFHFDDTSNSVYLLVGGGPKAEGNLNQDSEDIDNNGFLDGENDIQAERILSFNIANITGDTGWQSYTYSFTQEDREKLIRTRAVRIIITGADSIGRLLIDKIAFSGTSFGLTEPPPLAHTVKIREIYEQASKESPPKELEDVYSEVKDTFHASGQVQKVLEADWSGYGLGESWTLRGFTQTGTEGARYKEVNIYIRIPAFTPTIIPPGTPKLEFSLLDSKDRGIRWSMTPYQFNDWKHLKVDVDKKEVYLDNNKLNNTTVTVDKSYVSLTRLLVTLSDSVSGTLYLDELHLTDPQGAFGGAFSIETCLSLPGALVSLGDVPFISDLTVKENLTLISPGFSSLYGRPGQAWVTSSLTEISTGLFFLYLDMFFQVEGLNSDFYLGGGHNIKIPRYDFPVIFTDAYSLKFRSQGPEFSRSNSIDLTIAEKVNTGFITEASSIESIITQNWKLYFALNQEQNTMLDLDISLLRSAQDYTHTQENYPESWIYGYRFIAPWRLGAPIERAGSGGLGFNSLTEPLCIDIESEACFKSTDILSHSRTQENSLVYGLSFPINLNRKDNLTITPGYKRKWTGSRIESSHGDLLQDIEIMGYRFYTQSYLFNQIPVYEIYSDKTEQDFIEKAGSLSKAVYNPKITLNITRRIGSHFTSLFMPTSLKFDTGKSFEKDGDLFQFLTTYTFTYQTNSINLFGKFGAYPVFKFYNIDEIVNLFNMTLMYDSEGNLEKGNFSIENFLSLEADKENLFTLENRLNFTTGEDYYFSDKLIASYNWFIYPKKGISLPFLDKEIAKKGFFSHNESLNITWENRDKKDEVAFHPVNILITHETALNFPEHGSISLEISIGFDKETLPSEHGWDSIYRLVLRGGIQGKIQF